MNPRQQTLLGGVVVVLLAGAAAFGLRGLLSSHASGKAPQEGKAPAKVQQVLQEGELNRITLDDKAEERLNIRTAEVRKEKIERARVVGGEVIAPMGQESIVAAPLAGQLEAPKGGVPRPGERVNRGTVIFLLLPLLSPEARTTLAATRVEAEGQVKTAETQLEAASIALGRAERLLKDEAGSRRAVDEATAQRNLAQKSVEAARSRRDLLVRATGDFESGTASPIEIKAPERGVLRAVPARAGQVVPSGATLFDVASLERVWVRVPLYAGD